MKISLSWIQEFIDIKEYFEAPQKLADQLTQAGLEVEELKDLSQAFRFVVVGLILKIDKHPQADRLTVCQVSTTSGAQGGLVHQIVCGATNHKVGDKIVVALPGAILPNGVMIQKSILRGVESNGMLCSEKELGLAETSAGLMILDPAVEVGMQVADLLGKNDITFDLKVTPNRADVLSQYGLARELSTLLKKPLKKIEPVLASAQTAQSATASVVSIEVLQDSPCTRYSARVIKGVQIKPSPQWLQQRLEACGMKPINNVVDATNYVMLELGQPLHAFDLQQLAGPTIQVSLADNGESFKTFDGSDLTLKGFELVIKDQTKSVCLAGVIGNPNSGVTANTQDLLIESAHFQADSVRKTMRTHGLQTESGYRFSRGVDSSGTLLALDRVTELILKIAGGVAFSQAFDFYPQPKISKPVDVNLHNISQRLGYTAEEKTFEEDLKNLSCEFKKKNELHSNLYSNMYIVTPPSFRFDLESEIDFVEEYARLRGYAQFSETLPAMVESPQPQSPMFLFLESLRAPLQAAGASEACNQVFVSESQENQILPNLAYLENLKLLSSEKAVKIKNPLSADGSALRRTLLYSLFENLVYHSAQGQNQGFLFEVGKVFSKNESVYDEHWNLGLCLFGDRENLWKGKNPQAPLLMKLKKSLENLGHQVRRPFELTPWSDSSEVFPFYHSGQLGTIQSADLGVIGTFGSLHPQIRENFKIRSDAVFAEIHLEKWIKAPVKKIKVQPISKFPMIVRDLALVVKKSLPSAAVATEITALAGENLKAVEVFDLYQGENLAPGQKSLAFHLYFQKSDGSLLDEEINQLITTIQKKMKETHTFGER